MTRRRSERFVLWLLAASLCLMYVYKGHGASRQRESVAFVHRSSGGVIVRLVGDVPKPGVYRFPDGASVADVINVTVPQESRKTAYLSVDGGKAFKLFSGDTVEIGRSRRYLRLVKLTSQNFYEIINQKLERRIRS